MYRSGSSELGNTGYYFVPYPLFEWEVQVGSVHGHDPRDDYYIPTHTRLRHSRHLDGYAPIRASPFMNQSPNPQLIAIRDNHKPEFRNCSNYHPVIAEESAVGTYIFTISAYDKDPLDSGGTLTYQLITTPGEKQRVTVTPNTGEVYTNDVFDHDEPSREKEIYITVRVTDNGQPSLDDACTIRIVIRDINDNPPVFDKVSYSESVPQDLQLKQEVMRISATDIDDGNNSVVHYSLDPISKDASYFYIDPDNGVIFLNRTIDKAPGYKFKLSAIVKDMGNPVQQSSIQLDVTVVESNKKSPSFLEVPEHVIHLKEDYSEFQVPIASVRATSNIPNEEKVQFELVQGQTEQTNKYHTFVLEPEGNVAFVKIGNHMDYERITEYTLTIRIQNNYRLAAETIIQIAVEDVNDNIPIFSEIRSGTVLENEPPGTPVMQVRAIDNDATAPNNQVTYELADPDDPFEIDPVNGSITTMKMFDREDKSFYNIKILATDNAESALIKGKHNIGQQTFLIEIADKNDNRPEFTQETYIAESIAENANINELVTQVTALDTDTASIVTYSIVSGNTYDSFTIRNFTGEIRVNKELDYENITSFTLHVRAFDGIYEDFATVIIKIENLNDNPPIFLANYTRTIEEEHLYEGCVVKVEAYDPDIKDRNAPQNIVYALVKHEQKAFLEIDNDGCLKLTKPLDRDQPTGFARWQILIMAADQGGRLGSDSLRSTTEVILELTDINDNAPFLTNTQPVVWYENEPPGEVVQLTAKDYDSPENGPPFTFALNDTAPFHIKSKFQIRGNTLYAISTFDREEIKEYFIPIMITDSGTPRMAGLSTLHVVIGDRNDNAMAEGFSSPVRFYRDDKYRQGYYYYLGESPDTEVGRVYVVDPDDWDIGDKRFYWLPSYEERSPYFDVHGHTGMITMRQGTPNGTYTLRFNVTEENVPMVPFHWVEAVVNVTVKEIPEEAVDKSGSIRFLNVTAEEFIVPEVDGFSKKEKLHIRLAKLFNVSLDNVDIFTVSNKQTVKDAFMDVRFSAHGSPYYSPEKLNSMVIGIQDQTVKDAFMDVRFSAHGSPYYSPEKLNSMVIGIQDQTVKDAFIDVRFSAHGSPYYSPEKLNSMVIGIQDQLEDVLSLNIFMVHIDECLIEHEQCEASCRNVLIKNNVPLAVYTNTTSFIGVSARAESECTCEPDSQLICLNGAVYTDTTSFIGVSARAESECTCEPDSQLICLNGGRYVLIKNNVPLAVYTNTTNFFGESARAESECTCEPDSQLICLNGGRYVLIKNNVPLAVYTNTTSFIGESARTESECTCEPDSQLICLNGGKWNLQVATCYQEQHQHDQLHRRVRARRVRVHLRARLAAGLLEWR
ncbi:cadherin domain-containing protein [Phthorimaea operculella]|nr:cadherin domain-containing protein [Phthorimaea operculella]